MRNRLLPLLLPLLCTCQGSAPAAPPPRFLAIDLFDMQTLSGGKPMRYRLWDMSTQAVPPDSGPALSLRMALSAPLSADALQQAPLISIVLRGPDEQAIPVRTFSQDAVPADDSSVPGATYYLTLVPDVRSDRPYRIFFDPGALLSPDKQTFSVPPMLNFKTARRFAVIGATPPDGASRPVVSQLLFTFSTPAVARVSGTYGISITPVRAGAMPLSLQVMLSGDRRQLQVEPVCALPLGDSQVDIPQGGLEEDDSLVPISPYHATITVTQDPGPCQEAPDMG